MRKNQREQPRRNASTDDQSTPPLEDLIPLSELSQHIPPAPRGRKLHSHVPYRWAANGLGGARLKTITLPGTGKFTTLDWYRSFAAEVDQRRADKPTRRSRRATQHSDRSRHGQQKTRQVLDRHNLSDNPREC